MDNSFTLFVSLDLRSFLAASLFHGCMVNLDRALPIRRSIPRRS